MSKTKRVFRIALVGAQRNRVGKVLALLLLRDASIEVPSDDDGEDGEKFIDIEIVPCLAGFGSYEDAGGGQARYLSSVEYLGRDGTEKPSSLAPFFDETEDQDDVNGKAQKEEEESSSSSSDEMRNKSSPSFPPPGISAVAIGCGIEGEADEERIRSFFQTLSGGTDIEVRCVKPNEEYDTMREETVAFRSLEESERKIASSSGQLGPGKMAKFVRDVAKDAIESRFCRRRLEQDGIDPRETDRERVSAKDPHPVSGAEEIEESASALDAETAGRHQGRHKLDDDDRNEGDRKDERCSSSAAEVLAVMDPNKTRYACRMCRLVLFSEDQLEDPPHVPLRHDFKRKNARTAVLAGGGTSSSRDRRNGGYCENLFLSVGIDWMGDMGEFEGKFGCPNCSAKVGGWNWSGSQCSCGTWVVPSIKVPLSKVDTLPPQNMEENMAGGMPFNPTHVGQSHLPHVLR